LTSGAGLVIEQVNSTPSFTVTAGGLYTIHTLVYNPATLDLAIVVPGQTTGFDVNGLLVQGGGSICASLDVAGAPVTVGNPSAGTITTDNFIACIDNGNATVSATPDGNALVLPGYQTLYVLTRGFGLTIQQVNTVPSFTVSQVGLYRIHTLVYDPATLNLGIVILGQTTGFDVNSLLVQGGGSICASLDVQGAPTIVLGPVICGIFNLNSATADDLTSQTIDELKNIAESGIDAQLAIVKVYPNPASDYIQFELMQAGNYEINVTIINSSGQLVAVKTIDGSEGANSVSMDISGLAPGNYLLKVENGVDSVIQKFIKQY
jgi:hypothetical protein